MCWRGSALSFCLPDLTAQSSEKDREPVAAVVVVVVVAVVVVVDEVGGD